MFDRWEPALMFDGSEPALIFAAAMPLLFCVGLAILRVAMDVLGVTRWVQRRYVRRALSLVTQPEFQSRLEDEARKVQADLGDAIDALHLKPPSET